MSSDPDTPAMIDVGRIDSVNRFGRTVAVLDLDAGKLIFPDEPISSEEAAWNAKMRREMVIATLAELSRQATDFRILSELSLIAAEAAELLFREIRPDNIGAFDFATPAWRHAVDSTSVRSQPFTHYVPDDLDYGETWEADGPLAAALLEILRDQCLTRLVEHLAPHASGPFVDLITRINAGIRSATPVQADGE